MNKFLLLFGSGVLAGILSFSGFTVGTRFPVFAGMMFPAAHITKTGQPPVSGSIQMTITVDGLAQGETATLRIGRETASLDIESALFEYQIQGTGDVLTANISPTLEDGNYLLLLDTPGKYFREPKGYFFDILNSAIINPRSRTITFNLEPQPHYLASEAVVDLSAPAKEPIPLWLPPVPPLPLWQRLLEPSAILLSVIIVVAIGVIIWRLKSRASH